MLTLAAQREVGMEKCEGSWLKLVFMNSPLLFSPSYCDRGRQATLARTVWHSRTGTFLLSCFIFIILVPSIDITSSDHWGQIYYLPKWQPKLILNILKIFIITKKTKHYMIQDVNRQIIFYSLWLMTNNNQNNVFGQDSQVLPTHINSRFRITESISSLSFTHYIFALYTLSTLYLNCLMSCEKVPHEIGDSE